ncbi:GNAT family N-acetyltransferase [Streptomyces sp. NPDC050560]|uniref:GNAT family N-acetyltransferase n=1 Tax=Streptomyces sp. NPDC050560 TaxID=3365630 RepID=UPI00378E036F
MPQVRPMREEDIDAVSAVRVGGWRAAYRGMVPQTYLDALTVDEDARGRREMFAHGSGDVLNLVAEDRGAVVGWAALGTSREADSGPDDGELLALYAAPDRLRAGTGTALLRHALAAARERSYDALVLWVIAANTGARRFYERHGFAPDGAASDWLVDGTAVPELRYRTRITPAP